MKGSGATQSSGRSRGTVGVTPTGIELGLDVGIGQLGISTDYGGGIVIGIGGQKIVWGREGGKIYYNLGGFEVIVEARNCVVTETRKIAGQIVATHVYPDPGCKPPDPPKNPLPDPPPTPPSGDEPSVSVPNDDERYWAIVGEGYLSYIYPALRTSLPSIGDDINLNEPITQYPVPFSVERTIPPLYGYQRPKKYRFRKGQNVSFGSIVVGYAWAPIAIGVAAISSERYNEDTGRWEPAPYYDYAVLALIGTGKQLNKFFAADKDLAYEIASGIPIRSLYIQGYYFPVQVIPFKPASRLPPPPSGGNQPPMPESCCESLKADIEDIKEVLATKEILAGKITFPWKWRMPGGEGEEVIMDYPNLARALAQMIDHLGIHPPKLSIKDINNAIAGDQGLSNQFPSATQAFEALMAQIWDANGDIDTLTNFLYRLAWLCVQQSFNLAQLTGSVESLKDMIGGETEPLETELTTPFNIAAGTEAKKAPLGKGFGKSAGSSGAIDNRIDANTEMSTEAMLPEFLKIRQNPILVDAFSGKQDIFDLLLLIRADLEKLKNK